MNLIFTIENIQFNVLILRNIDKRFILKFNLKSVITRQNIYSVWLSFIWTYNLDKFSDEKYDVGKNMTNVKIEDIVEFSSLKNLTQQNTVRNMRPTTYIKLFQF